MKRALLERSLIALILAATTARAVDGVSVTTHWEGKVGSMMGAFGQIVKHEILNDIPYKHTVIHEGPASYPTFNQDGTRIACIKDDQTIAVMDSSGRSEQVLCSYGNPEGDGRFACLDWPEGDWVFFGNGGYDDYGSAEIWKVNVNTKQKVRAFTFVTADGEPIRQWHWGMSADGSRMYIRCHNAEGNLNGRDLGDLKFVQVPAQTGVDLVLTGEEVPGRHSVAMEGCGAYMSPSGSYGVAFAVGDYGGFGHGGLTLFTGFTDSVAFSMPFGLMNEWGDETAHTDANHTRWSANSDKWICARPGLPFRGKPNCDQVLYNWQDSVQIRVTRNPDSSYSYDCAGDFWVDRTGTMQPDNPTLYLDQPSLLFAAFATGPAPASQTVSVVNLAPATGALQTVSTDVAYDNSTGWLTASVSGSGDSQRIVNTIDPADLAEGTYTATVTVTCPNSVPSSQSYTVEFTIEQQIPLLDPVPDDPAIRYKQGLNYRYYETGVWASFEQDLNTLTPVDTGTVEFLDLSVVQRDRRTALSFSGYISVSMDAPYTFTLSSNDGSRLWIDGQLLIDLNAIKDMIGSATVGLKAGRHTIEVHQFNRAEGQFLQLRYASPMAGIPERSVPDGAFSIVDTDPPDLAIEAPAPGTTWTVGQTVNIRWSANDALFNGGVLILISPDAGETYLQVNSGGTVAPGFPGWGNYEWTVPRTLHSSSGEDMSLVSDNCIIRIHEYNDFSLGGETGGMFTIDDLTAVAADPAPAEARTREYLSLAHDGGRLALVAAVNRPGQHVISVFDAGGRLVYRTSSNGPEQYNMPIPATGAGLYIVRLETAVGSTTRRLAMPGQ